jgi:peptidoglycan/LPS O-acetylase OafA/YrhL
MARFARLYPLHFITLIAVAAIQAASFHLVGGFQICSLNDAYHFVLNLLFASNWGLQEEMSFNVPVWSVSVEIPIYAAFFFIAPFIFARGLLWPLVIAFGGWFVLHYVTFNSWFAMCAMYFFIGCGIWFLCQKLRGWMVIAISASSYATLAALTILVPKTPWLDSQILLFCPTVMLCTYFGCWSPLGRLRWFGDATYSLYLWHFPIIIVVNTVLAYNQVQRNAFSSPVALFAWVVLMIMVSRVSFRFIERPLQTMILRWLVRSPVADRAEQSSAAASQAVPAGRR